MPKICENMIIRQITCAYIENFHVMLKQKFRLVWKRSSIRELTFLLFSSIFIFIMIFFVSNWSSISSWGSNGYYESWMEYFTLKGHLKLQLGGKFNFEWNSKIWLKQGTFWCKLRYPMSFFIFTFCKASKNQEPKKQET